MRPETWLRAAALALALCSPARAADPIAYTNPDGVNSTKVTAATPLPVTCSSCSGGGGVSQGTAAASAPTYTAGAQNLSLDLSGNLRVYDANLASLAASATPAGTNIIGKVGIDQTTPGTTNAVQANIASGGVVSGAYATGAIADIGTLSSPAAGTVNYRLNSILTALGSPFQVGGSIGNTSFASTQSGTWTVQPGNTANTTPWLFTINQGGNSATVSAGGALKVDGSAVTQPVSNAGTFATQATLQGGTASVGSVGLDPSLTAATTVPVNISTAATTQLVALASSKLIYVTGGVIIAGGTGNITLEYGTGTACGTGTTVLSGAIPLVANVGFIIPANTFVVPSGNALCALTSAAVQYSGAIGYVQK